MNRSRPTLAELRARVQKDRHREIGNWLARRVARPTAVYGCWLAIRLGSRAHQVTLAACCRRSSAARGDRHGRAESFRRGRHAGAPGVLARPCGRPSRPLARDRQPGRGLSRLPDASRRQPGAGFRLGYGLAARSGDLRWTIAGFAIGTGWTILEPAQRLPLQGVLSAAQERERPLSGSTAVAAGGRSRRTWPRRRPRALTWPAFKACEPHVVLLVLASLALAAMVVPDALASCSGEVAVVLLAVAGAGAGHGADRARSIAEAQRRSRILAVVPADRTLGWPRTDGSNRQFHRRRPLDMIASHSLYHRAWSCATTTRSLMPRRMTVMTYDDQRRSWTVPQASGDVGIGVVGAGFIVRDCHLVAYASARFPRGRDHVAVDRQRHAKWPRCGASPRSMSRSTRCSTIRRSKSSTSPCRRPSSPA